MEELKFSNYQKDLDYLIENILDNLKNNWSKKYPVEKVIGGKFTLTNLFKISVVNYVSVFNLCKISEEINEHLYLVTPTLNRSIIENYFSMIFLLSDFPEHNKLFVKNSLRELNEKIKFEKENFIDNKEWKEYLENTENIYNKHQKFIIEDIGLKKGELKSLTQMQRFPRISKIIQYFEKNNHSDLKFFKYLEKYHYVKLSHFAHSQPSGLSVIGTILESQPKAVNERFLTNQLWTSIMLILCLISEIEIHFEYGLKTQINGLWNSLNPYSDYVKEVYELRYEKFFV